MRRSLAVPRRIDVLLATTVLIAVLGGCSPSAPADEPAAVVGDALAKVAAKDLDGLRGLSCSGQAEGISNLLGLPGEIGDIGAGMLSGFDVGALLDAVRLDTSGVKAGASVIDGDTAEVPVTGTLRVTFDKDTIRPILRPLVEQQGSPMTDEQLDALLGTLEAYGQDVPLDLTLRLVREGDAWKICPDVPAP